MLPIVHSAGQKPGISYVPGSETLASTDHRYFSWTKRCLLEERTSAASEAKLVPTLQHGRTIAKIAIQVRVGSVHLQDEVAISCSGLIRVVHFQKR